MKNSKYFKDLSDSIEGHRKTVLLIVLIQNDENLLRKIVFTKNDNNQLPLEFENKIIEQHESCLEYVIDQEESNIEKILKK